MSLIQNITRLAHTAFSKCHTEDVFHETLTKLRKLTSQLTCDDVNLSRELMSLHTNRLSFLNRFVSSAPVTYVQIYDNVNFSIGIFALRTNSSQIPLHDHPKMFGLIKVIFGSVKISQYSPLPKEGHYKIPSEVSSKVLLWQRDLLVPTVQHEDIVVNHDSDDTCFLTPTERNFHHVSAVNGPAAFVDILAPPYNSKDRECHYYSVIATVFDDHLKTNITWLLESVESPDYFWCDSSPYTGPNVSI